MERYLTDVIGQPVTVSGMAELGEVHAQDSVKAYGYGKPIRIDYMAANGPRREDNRSMRF